MIMFLRHTALFITACVFFSSCHSKIAAQQTTGEHTVYLPANLEKEVYEAVDDMLYWLEKAGAKKFTVQKGGKDPGKGIRLVRAELSDIPNVHRAEILKDGQSFYLFTDSYANAVITGTGKNSFINGIYTFLHELGFRWYMPGENWIKTGNLSNPISINKRYTPDFRDRFYAGSGGAQPIPVIDPADQFSKEVILWNRRNRVSYDYYAKGHAGIAFYNANKDELNRHPEYFCNKKVSKNPRLNYDQPGLVNLFVNWAHTQVKPGDRFPVIGVDPADGSGGADDCLPVTIPGIKTWSDKYYWMANKVAARLPANDEKTRVLLYAYNQYAVTPSFSLHKNVYPLIIPYAFQDVAEPEALINMWGHKMKGRQMGIYDYWNITQWSKCLPQFNIYAIEPRLRLWKKNNITSVQLESTYAKGPMGHAFWIAMQMMWDTDLSFDKLYNEFLAACFGKGAPDVKRMYDRWSLRYQGAMEAPLSNRDLAAAAEKETDKAAQLRISELKAYVRYIKLYEEYTGNQTVKGYEDLVRYIYSIHHTGMLHTSALQRLYIPKPKDYKPVTDKKAVEEANKRIKILRPADIENNFRNDLKSSPAVYGFSSLAFDIKKAKAVSGGEKRNNPKYINNLNHYRFYLGQAKRFTIRAGATNDTRLLVKDNKNKSWLDDTVRGTKTDFTGYELNLPVGEYVLSFGEPRRFSRIEFPEGIAFFTEERGYDNAGYPWQYIYVPSDVSELVYEDVLGPGINDRGFWLNPEGAKIQPQKLAGKVYKVNIPPAHRGKVWILNIGHRQFRMLNIPDIYSLNMFRYEE